MDTVMITRGRQPLGGWSSKKTPAVAAVGPFPSGWADVRFWKIRADETHQTLIRTFLKEILGQSETIKLYCAIFLQESMQISTCFMDFIPWRFKTRKHPRGCGGWAHVAAVGISCHQMPTAGLS